MKKSIVLVLLCMPLWASAQARLDSTRLAALMDEAFLHGVGSLSRVFDA